MLSRVFVFSLLMCFCLACSQNSLAKMPPHCNVPLAQRPVEIDGVIGAGEWEDAAVVRRFFDSGQGNIAGEPTEIYLKYDRDAIYLAARCHESQKGYPEAYKRPWGDLFFNNDDGVMFVMGMRDPLVAVQDKIEVGGYDGAMDGHKSKADWYYTFSVNAVGSTQRTFNEMPLEKKLFKASTQPQSKGVWTAEIKIPFASCGMKQMVGKKIFANIFRFRPPGLVGWYFPGWGGYRSMPLGIITFLPEARRDELTCESLPNPNLATDLKPHCKATIQYSPLNGAVVGKVEYQGYEEQLFGELNVTGFPVVRKELTETLQLDHNGDPIQAKKQVDYVYCDLVPGSQPERLAEFKVTNSNGRVLARVNQKLNKVTAPEWFGTDVGKEYISDRFPKPWTDPVVEDGQVHLLDKSLAFAANGMPSSISFKDGRGELLAADPQIQVFVDGKTLDFKPDQLTVVKDKVNVRVQASQKAGNVMLSTQNKIEPDGFMVVKFKIDHLAADRIERLMVRIPLRKDMATFVKHGPLVQKIGQLTGAGYRNEAKNIWVGTYDKGLDFNFDTQVFFSKNKRQQIQVIEEGDINWLVFNFVDGKDQVKEGDIFRFFLQPTPTKPMPEKRIRAWAKWKWERWSRWHGYPDLKPVPELKQWTQELAGKGLIGLLYTCQGLREDAPYFKAFRDDFLLQPHWRYYRDRNVNAYATNKRGPEGDLQLWAWDKLINEAGVRGFVSDGMIPAWGDSNPALRKGAGRKEAVSWDEDMTSSVVAQRQFIKRMCGMLTDTNEPYCVVAHTGGGVDVNTMSFIDGYMEGEQLYRYNRGYFLPEAIYAVGYSGQPWGWRSIYWNKQWRNYQGLDNSLAYALLYNTELYGNPSNEGSLADLEVFYKDFPPVTTEYIPYWKKNPYVQMKACYALSSTYLGNEKAMVVVSNLREFSDNYTLDFTSLFPGKMIRCTEMITNRKLTDTRVVQGQLPPNTCDVWRVDFVDISEDKTHEKPTKPVVIKEMDGSHWLVNRSKSSGVSMSYPVKHLGVDGWMKISPTPYRSRANAQLLPLTLDENATCVIEVISPGRFFIRLGEATLLYDQGWKVYIDGQSVGSMVSNNAPRLVSGQIQRLVLTLDRGNLDFKIGKSSILKPQSLQLQSKGNRLSLGTWHDQPLWFRALYLSNSVQEPDLPSTNQFDVTEYHQAQWNVNTQIPDVQSNPEFKCPDGRTGLAFFSKPYKTPARATFAKPFGDSFFVDLDIKLTSRFRIDVGPIRLTYGGSATGYGWYVQGPLQRRSNGWVFTQVPLHADTYSNLRISIEDQVMNVTCDDKVVVYNLPLDLPSFGNYFSIETWWDSQIELAVNQISTKSESIVKLPEVEQPVVNLRNRAD